MNKILTVGLKGRLKYSIVISLGITTCVYFMFRDSNEATPAKIRVLFVLVSALVFALLTIIRDLILEQHVGVKRLVTTFAALSGLVIPALYWAMSHLITTSFYGFSAPYYHFEEVLFWTLAVVSPPCIAALMLYSHRLIRWIREGFGTSK